MITPEPPAGSEHYREGWRHGYEQAAIDRERSADAVTAEARVLVARCDNYREDVDAPCTGEIRFRWGMSQSDPCDVCGSRCGIAVAKWERVETAGAVPDTVQAPDVAAPTSEDWDVEDADSSGYFIVKNQVTGAVAACELDDCDDPECVAEYGELWDAVDRARSLRKAADRALLGTDTTPEASRA